MMATSKKPEQGNPQEDLFAPFADYLALKIEGQLAGVENVRNKVREIYDEFMAFESNKGLEIIMRASPTALALGMANEFGISFRGIDGLFYELDRDGNFYFYQKIEGDELKKIERENVNPNRRADQLIPTFNKISITTQQFMAAYLTRVNEQLESSAQKLKELETVSLPVIE